MSQKTKPISFSLRECRLSGIPAGRYSAVARAYRTIGEEELISDMAGRNASVSRQEVMAVMDLMKSVVADHLLAGHRVNTDLFNARVSIRGGFDSADDEYVSGRNRVRVKLMAGAGLKRLVERRARVEKVRGRTPVPELDSVLDFETLSVNSEISPGRTAELKGLNLDFDRTDEAQGVFFLDNSVNPGRRAEFVHRMSVSRVLLQVPPLVPGRYRLEVRRKFGKELRAGRLAVDVFVADEGRADESSWDLMPAKSGDSVDTPGPYA